MVLVIPPDPDPPDAVLEEGKITTRGWNIMTDSLYEFYADAITKTIKMITPMRLRTLVPSSNFYYTAPTGTSDLPFTRRDLISGTSDSIGTINTINNTFIIYDNRLYTMRIENSVQTIYSYALDLTDEQLVGTFGDSFGNRMDRDATNFYSLPNNNSALQRYTLTGAGEASIVKTDLFDTELTLPHGMTSDGTYFYVIDDGDNHVYRYNLDGTGRTSHFNTGLTSPSGITTDGTHIYVVDNTTNHIFQFNLDGTEKTDYVDTDVSTPNGITINGDNLYVVDDGTNHVFRYSPGSTESARTNFFNLNLGFPEGITTDGTYLYIVVGTLDHVYRYNLDGTGRTALFDAQLTTPRGITTDGTYLYIVDDGDNHVYRYNLDGTNRIDLFNTNLSNPRGVATDGTYLYVVNASPARVYRYNLDGTNRLDLFNPGISGLNDITTDGTYLYIVDSAGNHVYRFNLDGTNRIDLFATGLGRSSGITIDGQYLYIGDFNNDTVSRYPIPIPIVRTDLFDTTLASPRGITNRAAHFFILDGNDNHVYRYNIEGTGKTDYLDAGVGTHTGLTTVGADLYTVDQALDHVFRFRPTTIPGRTQVADLEVSQNDFTIVTGDYVFVYGFESTDSFTKKIFRFNKSDGGGKLTIKSQNGIIWAFTDGTYLYYVRNNQVHRLNFDGTGEITVGSAYGQKFYAGPVSGATTIESTNDNLFGSDDALYWHDDLPPGVSHLTDSIVKMRLELEAHIPFNLDFAWESTLAAAPHAVNGGIDFEIYGSNDEVNWVREVFDEGGPVQNSSLSLQQNINAAKYRYLEFRWTERAGIYFRKLQFTRFRAFPEKYDVQAEKITFEDPS